MKPREFTLEFGYEGKLLWPPGAPGHKVASSVSLVNKEDYDSLLKQAEAMEKALILSRSKITGYVSIANHELDLAELREDLKSAHQINKNALENWQKFKEQK